MGLNGLYIEWMIRFHSNILEFIDFIETNWLQYTACYSKISTYDNIISKKNAECNGESIYDHWFMPGICRLKIQLHYSLLVTFSIHI